MLLGYTLSKIDIPDCDFEEAERLANPITASSDEDQISSIKNKEFEQFLNENISSKKYKEAAKMIANTTYGKNVAFRSTYHILKPAKELVKEYKIKNTEYVNPSEISSSATSSSNNNQPSTSSSSTRSVSLSANLLRNAEDNRIVLKSDTKTPEFLFGASLPLDTMMNLIIQRVGKIVEQIPGASLHDALGTSMLLGCADAAEMDSLPKVNQHITSFSMVPVSFFLVEKCGFLSSSIKNILPHNQLNSRELIDHVKHVLYERFHCWLSIKEKLTFEIEL